MQDVGPPLAEDEIRVIDGFLDAAACRRMRFELRFALWRPSLTYMRHADGVRRDVLSPLRVSETAQERFFTDEMRADVDAIERRFQASLGLDPAHLESWQATDYPKDGTFYYHMDAGYWDAHPAGDRMLTFLLYLTTPTRGGGTDFRALGRRIEARAGRLVVWNNLFDNGDSNHRMIHSGMPLLAGRKTTLVTWLRQKPFPDR